MRRRDFLALTSLAAAAFGFPQTAFSKPKAEPSAAWFRRSCRYASLFPVRLAYVERGSGPAALFLHGFPLNSYQWRGALERLHPYRRCIAPDLMSLGYTQVPKGQAITPETQVAMLGTFLDSLHVQSVDLVANDSGGIVAQLFVARHPERVRTLLLTNCDVDENNPPQLFLPVWELAKQGKFVDTLLVPQVRDKEVARSQNGLAPFFTYPLSDQTIDIYLGPLVESDLRKSQCDQYAVALGANVLVAVREDLKRWKGPAKIIWGMSDILFDAKWADWLDHTLPGSRGVRQIKEAHLFFPEEFPDIIAEEAKKLWEVR